MPSDAFSKQEAELRALAGLAPVERPSLQDLPPLLPGQVLEDVVAFPEPSLLLPDPNEPALVPVTRQSTAEQMGQDKRIADRYEANFTAWRTSQRSNLSMQQAGEMLELSVVTGIEDFQWIHDNLPEVRERVQELEVASALARNRPLRQWMKNPMKALAIKSDASHLTGFSWLWENWGERALDALREMDYIARTLVASEGLVGAAAPGNLQQKQGGAGFVQFLQQARLGIQKSVAAGELVDVSLGDVAKEGITTQHLDLAVAATAVVGAVVPQAGAYFPFMGRNFVRPLLETQAEFDQTLTYLENRQNVDYGGETFLQRAAIESVGFGVELLGDVGMAIGGFALAGPAGAIGVEVAWNKYQFQGPGYATLRKLTDENGDPLLNHDQSAAWGGFGASAAGIVLAAPGADSALAITGAKKSAVRAFLTRVYADSIEKLGKRSKVAALLTGETLEFGGSYATGVGTMVLQGALLQLNTEAAKAANGQSFDIGAVGTAAASSGAQALEGYFFTSLAKPTMNSIIGVGRITLGLNQSGQIHQAFAMAEAVKLAESNPALAAEALDTLFQGGELETFYIDKAGWDTHFEEQGKDPAAEAERIFGSRDAYEAAVDKGHFEVKGGEYLMAFKDSSDKVGVARHTRLSTDSFTPAQIESLDARAEEIYAESPDAGVDLYAKAYREFRNGGATHGVADSMAKIHHGHFETAAARYNVGREEGKQVAAWALEQAVGELVIQRGKRTKAARDVTTALQAVVPDDDGVVLLQAKSEFVGEDSITGPAQMEPGERRVRPVEDARTVLVRDQGALGDGPRLTVDGRVYQPGKGQPVPVLTSRTLAAVVPKDASDATLEKLSRDGVKQVHFYDPAVEGARDAVVADAVGGRDVLFQESLGEDGMVVQHNISEAALRFSLSEYGGLLAPSIGVAKAKAPLTGFGGISLLGSAQLVDPESGALAFGADAFTPRHPEVGRALTDIQLDTIADRFRAGTNALDLADQRSPLHRVGWVPESFAVGVETGGIPSIFEQPMRATIARAAFLDSLGVHIPNFYSSTEGISKLQALVEGAGLESEFKAFVEAQFADLDIKETFFSKIEGDFVDASMERILQEMTAQIRGGEKTGALGEVRAHGVTQFRSLKEMKAARDRLVDQATFQEARDAMHQRLTDLVGMVEGAKSPDDLAALVEEFYKTGEIDPQVGGAIVEGTLEPDFVLNDVEVQIIKTWANDFRDMVTEYFEVKLPRAVSFAEFQAAVIPAGTSADIKELLSGAGLEVVEYAGGADSRQAAIESTATARDLLFQHGIKVSERDGGTFRVVPARGQIEMGVRDQAPALGVPGPTFKVTLFGNDNASTIIHEYGHFLFESFSVLAQLEGAPADLKADFDKLVKWMKYDDMPTALAESSEWRSLNEKAREGELTPEETARQLELTSKLERFSVGFEAYIRSGKAPSVGLIGAFYRLSTEMHRIYRSYKQLFTSFTRLFSQEGKPIDPPRLNDEIDGIMHRLFATNEQIAAVRKGIFAAADESLVSKMDPKRQARYARFQRRIAMLAETDLLARAAQESKKAQADLLAEDIQAAEKVAEEEIGRQHVYRTIEVLDGALGIPIRMDRAAVDAILGEGGHRSLPKRATVKAGGRSPQEVAAQMEWGSPEDMLVALSQAAPRDQAIESRKQQILKETFPTFANNPEQVVEAAAEAVVNDGLFKSLLEMTHDVHEKLRGKKGLAQIVTDEALAGWAHRNIQTRPRSDIRPGVHRNSIKLAMQRVGDAMEKGDLARAEKALLDARTRAALAKAADAARKQADTVQGRWRSRSTDKYRSTFGKAHPIYLGMFDSLFGVLGFSKARRIELKGPEGELVVSDPLGTVEGFLIQLREDGVPVEIVWDDNGNQRAVARDIDSDLFHRILSGKKSFQDLTPPEIRALDKSLQALRHISVSLDQVQFRGEKLSFDDGVKELADAAQRNLPVMPQVAFEKNDASLGAQIAKAYHKARMLGQHADARMLIMETMVGWLDGNDQEGAWREMIFEPLLRAGVKKGELAGKLLESLRERWDNLPESFKDRENEKLPAGVLGIPKEVLARGNLVHDGHTRQSLMMIALNMGNESNRDRLLGGYGWTEEEVMAALNHPVYGLTKEEGAWIQSVFDTMEELYGAQSEVHQREKGLPLGKILAKPLGLASGAIKGGYFPAKYDPRVARSKAVWQARAVEGLVSPPGMIRPATPQGNTKSRSEGYSNSVNLDWGLIQSHISEVIHDITHREAVRQVGRFLVNDDVMVALDTHLGEERRKQFMATVQAVAHEQRPTVADELQKGHRAMLAARSLLSVQALGLSIKIAAGDLPNVALPAAAAILGKEFGVSPKYLVPWLAKAAPLAGAAVGEGITASLAQVHAKSAFMQTRAEGFQAALAKEFGDIGGDGGGILQRGRDTAYYFTEKSDALTTTPVWLSAYDQFQSESTAGMTPEEAETQAVRFADGIVRKFFPTFSALHQAGLVRDKHTLVGGLTVFFSFMSQMYNQHRGFAHESYKAHHDPRMSKLSKGKRHALVIGSSLAFSMVYSAFGDLFMGRGPEDDEGWEDWMLRRTVLGPVSTIPFAGDAAEQGWRKYVQGKPPIRSSPRTLPLASLVEDLIENAETIVNEGGEEALFAAMNLIGLGLRLPARAPLKSVKAVRDMQTGEQRTEGTLDKLEKGFYGNSDYQNRRSTPFTAFQREAKKE